MRRLTPTAERTMTRPGHSSPLRRGAGGLTAQTAIRERGRRFRHHHAAAHTDRGENHDPTGTLITAQALNGGLDRPTRNKRTVPPEPHFSPQSAAALLASHR